MLARLWPLLLRIALGMYFIYPNLLKLIEGTTLVQKSLLGCIDQYIPVTIAFTAYYGFLILVGVLVIALIRYILPLALALIILSAQLYINFKTFSYTPQTMLLFILILVTLAIIIYTQNVNRFASR